jgi:phenylalanine-4-hydroxylase
LQDFAPIYARLAKASEIPIEAILPTDQAITRGTQAYARARAAAAQ